LGPRPHTPPCGPFWGGAYEVVEAVGEGLFREAHRAEVPGGDGDGGEAHADLRGGGGDGSDRGRRGVWLALGHDTVPRAGWGLERITSATAEG